MIEFNQSGLVVTVTNPVWSFVGETDIKEQAMDRLVQHDAFVGGILLGVFDFFLVLYLLFYFTGWLNLSLPFPEKTDLIFFALFVVFSHLLFWFLYTSTGMVLQQVLIKQIDYLIKNLVRVI